jgi:hypothetical protein
MKIKNTLLLEEFQNQDIFVFHCIILFSNCSCSKIFLFFIVLFYFGIVPVVTYFCFSLYYLILELFQTKIPYYWNSSKIKSYNENQKYLTTGTLPK